MKFRSIVAAVIFSVSIFSIESALAGLKTVTVTAIATRHSVGPNSRKNKKSAKRSSVKSPTIIDLNQKL